MSIMDFDKEFTALTSQLPELRIEFLIESHPELERLYKQTYNIDCGGVSIANLSELATLLNSLAGLCTQFITRSVSPDLEDPKPLSSEATCVLTALFETAWDAETALGEALDDDYSYEEEE